MAVTACANGAGEQGVTLEELRRMGDEEVIALGSCQGTKVIEDLGQEKADEYFAEYADDVADVRDSEEVISVQEHMLKDGYTCTRKEMEMFSGREE